MNFKRLEMDLLVTKAGIYIILMGMAFYRPFSAFEPLSHAREKVIQDADLDSDIDDMGA